jgi:type IV pilus assembly protein PilC
MPVFTFSGKTASGEKVQGERVASTKDGLASQLRKERITPGRIREKGKEFSLPTFGSGKVKVKDVAVFFRQFSVMIDAGLPLVQCLEILGANQENPSFQKTLLGVRTTVEGGATLANAMRQYPVVFDDLTTNMIEAGETGGILDLILQRLAIYVEKAVKLRSAVKSALIYPVAVVSLADADCGRAAQVGGADLRQPLCRIGSCSAAADPHCHRPQRFVGHLLVDLYRGCRGSPSSVSSRFASTRVAAITSTP